MQFMDSQYKFKNKSTLLHDTFFLQYSRSIFLFFLLIVQYGSEGRGGGGGEWGKTRGRRKGEKREMK